MALHGASGPPAEVFPLNMGEEAAFDYVFRLYHAPVRYFCEQHTGDAEASEDIVSHLFLQLWQRHVYFEGRQHAQGYLYRAAKNACLNYIRSNKSSQTKSLLHAADMEAPDHYFDTLIRTEVWAELYRAIECLPSQCAKVITLSYIEGKTNLEIAEELNLSLQTVKNHKGRGLGLLKDKLPPSMLLLLMAAHFLS